MVCRRLKLYLCVLYMNSSLCCCGALAIAVGAGAGLRIEPGAGARLRRAHGAGAGLQRLRTQPGAGVGSCTQWHAARRDGRASPASSVSVPTLSLEARGPHTSSLEAREPHSLSRESPWRAPARTVFSFLDTRTHANQTVSPHPKPLSVGLAPGLHAHQAAKTHAQQTTTTPSRPGPWRRSRLLPRRPSRPPPWPATGRRPPSR